MDRLVALNRRPKMGSGAYSSGLMEPYWVRFADLDFRPRLTPVALVLMGMLPAFGAVSLALGGGLIAVAATVLAIWTLRVGVRKLPPVPTRRAGLEVRQNDLRMEIHQVEVFWEEIVGRAGGTAEAREAARARLRELRRELDRVEDELADRYEDWRGFLAEERERSAVP